MRGVFEDPRGLARLGSDQDGQLATEWVLVTAFLVMPMVVAIPSALVMIRKYFYRVAEVVCLPFP